MAIPEHHLAYDAGCWFSITGKSMDEAKRQASYWGINADAFMFGYTDGFTTCPIG